MEIYYIHRVSQNMNKFKIDLIVWKLSLKETYQSRKQCLK